MNYYEHHLGDYSRETAHLSMLEDCAYRRLLDAYYVREKPLPVDVFACHKLARANTKAERDAVAYVLREFFQLGPDGHHQSRADAEIARFHDRRCKASASARSRWSNRPAPPEGDTVAHTTASAGDMRSDSDGNALRGTRADADARPSPPTSLQSPPTDSTNPRVVRGTRLPADWSPGDEGLAFAREQGLSDSRAKVELAKFQDYWSGVPGQKGKKADWPATWRNWIRRASGQPESGHQAVGDTFSGAI